jgi:hypothetical protein
MLENQRCLNPRDSSSTLLESRRHPLVPASGARRSSTVCGILRKHDLSVKEQPMKRWCFVFAIGLILVGAFWGQAAEPASGASPFRFAEQPDQGTLTLYDGARPVLVYNFADQLKPGLPPDRKRACYIHPIYGLDGETLTEDFPPEGHFHHRGLCWTWAEVHVGDRLTDPWDLRGIRARFRQWLQRQTGPETAVLEAQDDWVLDEKQVVATEVLYLRVETASDRGRIIDAEWRFEAKHDALQVAGRKAAGYGGFLLRFPALPETVLTTDSGPQPTDANLKPCTWADLSSRFGSREQRSGVAVFLHPQHPGQPVGWTLRKYGLLNPAWPGTTPVKVEPGKPLVLRYRLWIHRGDATAGVVAEAYEAYRKTLAGGRGASAP